jgi:hypothetical protein
LGKCVSKKRKNYNSNIKEGRERDGEHGCISGFVWEDYGEVGGEREC